MVGSVYNHNNVPLDVDPKCIFVVQIYYRVLFFSFLPKMNRSVKTICLFGAWGGAVTSCLKLHEVFTKSSNQISLQRCQFFFFLFPDCWHLLGFKMERCILMIF